MFDNYSMSGSGSLTSANLTLQLNSSNLKFYSPLIVGNITLNSWFFGTTPVINLTKVYPSGNVNVTRYQFFNVTFNVSCLSGSCGTINISLDPTSTILTNASIEIDDDTLDGSSNAEICYVDDEDAPPSYGDCATRWNLTSIPSGSTITEALMCTVYERGDVLEDNDIVQFFGVTTDSGWTISSASFHNATQVNFINYTGAQLGSFVTNDTQCWNITSWIAQEFAIGRYHPTVNAYIFNDADGQDDYFAWDTKEATNISRRPYLNITYDGGKGGLVKTTIGTIPFYTNASTNPQTTASLNAGQSEIVTFWVNATGNLNSVNEFFAYANLTSDLSIGNITSHWNVTIISDSTSPTYSHNSTNNTLAGRITNFAINVTDNIALHPNGQYVFSTNNTGSWINDSDFVVGGWKTNTTINASLQDIGIMSVPSVFYKDSSWYLISGGNTGNFYGYAWNGTQWNVNLTINASLPAVANGYSAPSVFYKDSSWYLISGGNNGNFYGYAWNGTDWLINTTINNNLPAIGASSIPSVFYKDSSWYLIAGEFNGGFYGYAWNGTQWNVNLTINASLPDIGTDATPNVFYKDSSWYLIAGEFNGGFYGFVWNGTNWNADTTINASLSNLFAFSSPSVFYKDSSWYLISGENTGLFYGYNFTSSYNFTTTPSWANVTKTLNSTNGTFIGYRWYFRDNAGNTNSTPVYVLTTTLPGATPPTISFEPPTPDNASTVSSPNGLILTEL
jgi:hypothetical protein